LLIKDETSSPEIKHSPKLSPSFMEVEKHKSTTGPGESLGKLEVEGSFHPLKASVSLSKSQNHSNMHHSHHMHHF
jgi:hypothetical protein